MKERAGKLLWLLAGGLLSGAAATSLVVPASVHRVPSSSLAEHLWQRFCINWPAYIFFILALVLAAMAPHAIMHGQARPSKP